MLIPFATRRKKRGGQEEFWVILLRGTQSNPWDIVIYICNYWILMLKSNTYNT
jgi:hypothetical protein